MVADSFQLALNEVGAIHHVFEGMIDTGFLIFARLMGFMLIAPIFGRKDLPFTMKLSIALMLTLIMIWTQSALPTQHGLITSDNVLWYTMQIIVNVTVGLLIGFIGAVIMETINAAGSIMNNQIGLSSAMMFDPASRQQVALLEKLFGFIGLMVLFNMGGIYWLLDAIQRSFEVFPLYSLKPDLMGQISVDYLVHITGNALAIGTQLVAPVMVVTIAVDLILGIINRTAQQIQVFQLSFALKPTIGLLVFLITLPMFVKLVENYLADYSRIF